MVFVDSVFGVLSQPLGGILGAAVATATIGLLAIMFRRGRAPQHRLRAAIAICGFVLSAGLAAPYALTASRYETARGPYGVQQAILVLPSLASDRYPAPVLMQIWFPVKGAANPPSTLKACAQLQFLPLADAGNPARLVLYMPHFGSLRTDNTARLSYLASYGYVVVAFDDIAQDFALPGATPEEEEARLRMWHVLTQPDFDKTLRLDDIRVKLQAEKALSGLSRLAACAVVLSSSHWKTSVVYTHVGFLGYSFGGSTAAEATVMDSRIVAVVNLDGALFGQARLGRLTVPYLYVMSDRPIPTMSMMMSKDPDERYGSRIDALDRHEQVRLASRNGSAGILIKGSVHASLSDAALQPHLSRLWLFENPIAFFNAVNLYTLDFFDIHLRGQNVIPIDRILPTSPVARTFAEIGMIPDRHFALPPSPNANRTTAP